MVTLWTIQDERAWEVFQTRGILRADGRRVWSTCRPAYQWLIGQMRERLGNPQIGYPIWAWPTKPDLRHPGHLERGQRGVRVQFLANESDYLLSSFDNWCLVLSGWHMTLTEEEHEDFLDRVRDRTGSEYYRLDDLPADLRTEVYKGWERIFDLELEGADPDWVNAAPPHQATLPLVRLDQVVKVDHFVSR